MPKIATNDLNLQPHFPVLSIGMLILSSPSLPHRCVTLQSTVYTSVLFRSAHLNIH